MQTRQCPADSAVHHTVAIRVLVGRLINAIKAEIGVINQRGGSQFRPAAVLAISCSQDKNIYEIDVGRRRHHLRAGSALILLDGKREIAAQVTRAQHPHISVTAASPILGPLDQVFVRTQSAWLWEAVGNSLTAYCRAARERNNLQPRWDLVDALLRGVPTLRDSPVTAPTAASASLNFGQLGAFRNALRNAVYFVWGPPGTGKTTVLACITEALVRGDRSVLYVTPSNAAADVATEKIAEHLTDLPDIDAGLVLRYGRGVGRSLRGRWGSRVVPHLVFERLAAEALVPPPHDAHALRQRTTRIEQTLLRCARHADTMLRETGRRLIRRMRLEAEAHTIRRRDPARCRVIITTAHQLALSPSIRRFDTVIIDEASQMSLPLVLLAAAHADSGIIVGGDPRQLPPVVESRRPWVKRLLGMDVFTFADVTRVVDPAICAMLVEQHRMAPAISTLVSALAYGGKLRPHESVHTRRVSAYRREYGGLAYIDTSATHSSVTLDDSGSRENLTHARIAAIAISDLRAASLVLPTQSIAVVAPFVAQTVRLNHELSHTGVETSTVHAYQGAEVDFLVLDLTDAPGAAVSRFLQASGPEDDGGRLLTVALSRAREGILLIADFSFLEANAGAYVRALLSHMRRYGTDLSVVSQSVTGRFGARGKRAG